MTQLGSERYEDREGAPKALDVLGPTSLEALRTALTGRDEEKGDGLAALAPAAPQ